MQIQYQDRYKIIKKISSGGISDIFLGEDILTNEEIIVKSLRKEYLDNTLYTDIFLQEAQALSILKHPNIIPMVDSGVDKSTPYIILIKIEGNDLKTLIRESGKLTLTNAIDIAIELCNVVCFIHETNFIHGDIKPQNILIQNLNKVMLSDFGLARPQNSPILTPKPSIVWGSPKYFAPETTLGYQSTFATDVYCIGIVLYEMLVGYPPFSGNSVKELAYKHRVAPINFPDISIAAIPESIIHIIRKSLQKSPNSRYSSACSLKEYLEMARESLSQT